MKSANVTISRVMGAGGSYMAISIEDDASLLGVIRLNMSLEDFACCVTGHGHIHAEVEWWIGKNAGRIGMIREGKDVLLTGRPPYEKNSARKWVAEHPELILADSWELHSDGTTTQQHVRDKHQIHLVRYVDLSTTTNEE